MNRRSLFAGSSAALLSTLVASAWAQNAAHDHSKHDHAHMHGGGAYQDLIEATSDCVVKGQACLAHCLVLLSEGEKEMAACAKSVEQLLAVCGALQNLASHNAPLVKSMAKVALEACQLCEKECRKHERKHAECKACAQSCAECVKECKALAA